MDLARKVGRAALMPWRVGCSSQEVGGRSIGVIAVESAAGYSFRGSFAVGYGAQWQLESERS